MAKSQNYKVKVLQADMSEFMTFYVKGRRQIDQIIEHAELKGIAGLAFVVYPGGDGNDAKELQDVLDANW